MRIFKLPVRSMAVLGLLVGTLLMSACAHHGDTASEMKAGIAPFTQTRNQTVALVTTAKRSLGASDVKQLAVTYGSLQASANGYAGFLAESANVTTFDSARNDKYATSLTTAIKAFNHSFIGLSSVKQGAALVPSAWVTTFAQSVESNWNQYHATFVAASPQTKAALMKQLSGDTVWPNFEDMATESLVQPSSH